MEMVIVILEVKMNFLYPQTNELNKHTLVHWLSLHESSTIIILTSQFFKSNYVRFCHYTDT